jgi:hypothetical protein
VIPWGRGREGDSRCHHVFAAAWRRQDAASLKEALGSVFTPGRESAIPATAALLARGSPVLLVSVDALAKA